MAISKINSKALVDCSVAAVDIADGSITSAKLAGSIANAKLANSSITVNGNTVSLGASGSIPPVQWQSVVTADGSTTTTAVSGNGYFIDTTSAAHTITLPASPSAGDYVAIKDYAGTFGTNSLTIGRNSENIQGVANDSLISTNKASIVLVYIDSTKGWLYTVESNVQQLYPSFISATGGTITTSGDYKIHSFTGDGCFVVSSLGGGSTPCAQASTVDYLVVAGGAGGGAANPGQSGGAGGGAGGYRESKDSTLSSPHTASPLAATTGLTITASTYPVTVGGGGAGGSWPGPIPGQRGSNGSNSVFSTITSTGGGGGGGIWEEGAAPGNPGGSGGGSSINQPAGSGNTPPTSPPQGNDGGTRSPGRGGGGGAGAAAGSPGAGGPGVTSSITGSPVARGGGGAGSSCCSAPGGGGASLGGVGSAGTANTGGGGGGTQVTPSLGAAGGKGIVIIRYKYQ